MNFQSRLISICALVAWLSPNIVKAEKTSLYVEPQTPHENAVHLPTHRPASGGEGINWGQVTQGNPIILPATPVSREIETLKLGEIVSAHIAQSVLAFSDDKAPVSATLYDKTGRNVLLLGEAILEKNSKRILINFKSARYETSKEVFELKAQALALDGILGLKGEYVSGESKYFAAEFAAAAAAGFADASVTRTTNAFGTQQDEKSLDSSTKKALGSALSRTADRFAEKVRQAPEYSVLKGPIQIKLLILEQPKRKL